MANTGQAMQIIENRRGYAFGGWPGSARVERHIPLLPYSKEVGKLKRLKQGLALYRMVFGQPRQEDLLFSLSQNGNHESVDLADWLIALQPPETVLNDEQAEENALILPQIKSIQGR